MVFVTTVIFLQDQVTVCDISQYDNIINSCVCVSPHSTYGPVMTLEQRRRYQEDFCAEYDEYKDLHSRIATITHMFVQLGSKIKSLSPGTQEYKVPLDLIRGARWCYFMQPNELFQLIYLCGFLYCLDHGRPNTRKVQQVSKGKSNIRMVPVVFVVHWIAFICLKKLNFALLYRVAFYSIWHVQRAILNSVKSIPISLWWLCTYQGKQIRLD